MTLAALLAWLALRGAQEPAFASGEEAVKVSSASVDENGLTREERRALRRRRRAERRRLRAERGLPEDEEDAEPPEDAEAPRVQGKTGSAVRKAMAAGDALKAGFGADAMGGLQDQGKLEGLGKDGAAGSGPDGAGRDPSNPRTRSELAVAVQSGYKGALDAVGLKLAPGPGGARDFRRKDGSPATPEDIEALRARIESEPAALMRRPDFFEAIPRERYQDLKRDYRDKPELKGTAFKDVGTTAKDRDFVWERSCDRLSGDCNPAAGKGEYKKNAEVPPEDLDSIWKSIYGTTDTFLKAVFGRPNPPAPATAVPGRVSGSLARRTLERVRGAIGAWLGVGPEDDGDPGVGGPEGGAAGSAGGRSAGGAISAGGAGGAGPGAGKRSAGSRLRPGRLLCAGLCLGAVVLALVWAVARAFTRRRGGPDSSSGEEPRQDGAGH